MPKASIQKWFAPGLLVLGMAPGIAMTTGVVFASVPTGAQSSPGKQASAPNKVVGVGVNVGNASPNKPANPQVVLYDQYDNLTANATSAQNFEAANDAYDDMNADDFVVPAGPAWNVNMVEIDGAYFPGSTGPLVSVNIVFRNDAAGLPGGAVPGGTFMNQAYVNGPNAGDLIVNLPSSVTMGAGHYWMDVQGNMDFSAGGQWGWADRSVTSNTAAAWQNPGGGFGTACTPTWGIRSTTCNIDPANPDQVFRLSGSTGPTPTPPLVTDTPTPTFTVTLTRTPLSTPTCLPQLVIFDGSKQKPGAPAAAVEDDARPTDGKYGFAAVAIKQNPGKAEYMAPDASFILALDDGTLETSIGFGSNAANTETSAIWLNRFSPGAPLVLPYSIQNISIFWPSGGNNDPNGQTFITETPKLLIYADPTTGNGPSDAVLIYQADVTVGVTNTWATYNINPGIAITQTEDIYAGFIDQWADGGGYQPRLFSASIDTSIPHQLRSWLSYGAGATPPDINNLGLNTNATIETASGGAITGNWGIRLIGDDNRPGSCPPTSTPNVSPTGTPTRSPTPTRTGHATPPHPCDPNSYYSVTTSMATIVPGTTLVAGSQADDANLLMDIGFTVRFYGLEFNGVNLSTNGNLQFSSVNSMDYTNVCLPAPSAGGDTLNNLIAGFWDDLDMTITPTLGSSGIYTSVSGSAPNRILNIEWRACKYNAGTCGGDVNFEVRLYENSNRIDMIYGVMTGSAANGISATVGVQQRTGTQSNYFTEYSCNSSSLSSGRMLTFMQMNCTPTATPTCPPMTGIKQTIGLNNPGTPNLVKGSNNGTYKFAAGGKAASKQASGFAPTLPISMLLDDGSRENAVSFGNNTAPTTSTAAIWLNRFSPGTYNLPMTITQISVLWPTTTGGTMIGKTTRLLVYLDANADNDPSDAVLQGQASVTIGITETFENYAVSIPVAGNNGDVYIGFEDQWAENGGVSPRLFSSALDETRSQARSWLMGMSTGANPDLNNLGNNDFLATDDSIGLPGNWMIRANASTANRFCQPAGVINGHLTWAGISQPNPNNVGITATLTLCNGASQVYSDLITTNNTGNFTASTGLPDGTYAWKFKNIMSLGNSGTLTISGGGAIQEFGTMRAGDCNDTNIVNSLDFTILKTTFGKAPGQTGYDQRANFNRDGVVNSSDFTLLKNSFGQGGAAQTCP